MPIESVQEVKSCRMISTLLATDQRYLFMQGCVALVYVVNDWMEANHLVGSEGGRGVGDILQSDH